MILVIYEFQLNLLLWSFIVDKQFKRGNSNTFNIYITVIGNSCRACFRYTFMYK